MNKESNQETNQSTTEEPTNQPDPQTPQTPETPETEESTDTQDTQDSTDNDSADNSDNADAVSADSSAPGLDKTVADKTATSSDDDDDYGKRIIPQHEDLPVFDPSKLPIDENGLLDANALGKQFNETLEKRDAALMNRIQNQQRAIDTERQ